MGNELDTTMIFIIMCSFIFIVFFKVLYEINDSLAGIRNELKEINEKGKGE